jgi:hypothetical protein
MTFLLSKQEEFGHWAAGVRVENGFQRTNAASENPA